MDTVILKFGGSSVANDERLNLVVQRIINFYKKNKRIVIVVSAQGKTTDNLLEEAFALSAKPNRREMDVLLSVGEQMTMAKLAILLIEKGYKAVSLTGWQAGIETNDINQSAIIEKIDVKRINTELDNGNIVIIAGFQGINQKGDITTLGRGGSDTTAVAIAAALNSKECHIYSDVDGIYSADPNKIKNAKKINEISYDEMLEISSEGAKVLHNRCIEIGEKYDIPIISKSTFTDGVGTIISNKKSLEGTVVRNIVKKEISRVSIIGHGFIPNNEVYKKIMNIIEKHNLDILNIDITRTKISIVFKTVIDDNLIVDLHREIIE